MSKKIVRKIEQILHKIDENCKWNRANKIEDKNFSTIFEINIFWFKIEILALFFSTIRSLFLFFAKITIFFIKNFDIYEVAVLHP